ncbi:MAG TPA: hypothetical protein VI749_01460 [Candidatus Omnitrophota bacterium]|nr:hypothetical protein [Candidatus Omnitrophota bacterium]
MIMLLGILSLISLVIGPRLFSMVHQNKLLMEARKVKEKIVYTQQAAITKQRIHKIFFDVINDNYTISYDASSNGGFVPIGTFSVENGVFINFTDFTVAGTHTIDFDHFGTPTDSGNIELIDQRGDTIQINVASTTGKVEIL